MNTVRWQSYAGWKLGPRTHALMREHREREDERQADAAYRLMLRDEHDEGWHLAPVRLCHFCERSR